MSVPESKEMAENPTEQLLTEKLLAEKSDKEVLFEDETLETEFILKDLGGSFGKFQLFSYCLYSIPMFICGVLTFAFVFSASNVEYRCNIPHCDDNEHPQYDVSWMADVIPYKNSKPMKCYQYEPIISYNSSGSRHEYCSRDNFSNSSIVRCEQNGIVYATDEVSVVDSFNLTCEENEKWISMVGSFSQIARLVFLPIMSRLSDRFGARIVLLYGTIFACVCGFIQSYSWNYPMFVVCEFLCVAATCTLFPSAVVLAMEWAEVEHRSITSSAITIMDGVGGIFVGLSAAYANNFRIFLRINYAVSLVLISLLFLGSESFRWLLANGKRKRIEQLLTKAARINGRELSEQTFSIIDRRCEEAKNVKSRKVNDQPHDKGNSLRALFTCPTLAARFCFSVFVWIGTTFVSYGIHVISVSLGGDKYTSFTLIMLGGFPSTFIIIYMLKYIGRRTCISISLVIAGVCVILGKILPTQYTILSMAMFFASKCFSKVAFLILYIHTSEMWPTALRHTMMGLTSTLGRIGSILAPVAPLLSHISELIPFLTFASMSILAGLVVLLLPETFGKTLPDTLEDARNLDNAKQMKDDIKN